MSVVIFYVILIVFDYHRIFRSGFIEHKIDFVHTAAHGIVLHKHVDDIPGIFVGVRILRKHDFTDIVTGRLCVPAVCMAQIIINFHLLIIDG